MSTLDDVKNSGNSFLPDNSVQTSEIPAVHIDTECVSVILQDIYCISFKIMMSLLTALSVARASPFVLAAKAPVPMGKCEEAQVTPPD